MGEEVSMEYLLEQVMQKDLGRRLQVGQEVIELILDEEKSPELEQDQTLLDRMVEAVASSWVNSSNFKVRTVQVLCDGSFKYIQINYLLSELKNATNTHVFVISPA